LRGNTNYKGPTATAIFALTDNLSIQGKYDYSTEITSEIGGLLRYSKAELKFLYVF